MVTKKVVGIIKESAWDKKDLPNKKRSFRRVRSSLRKVKDKDREEEGRKGKNQYFSSINVTVQMSNKPTRGRMKMKI